MIERVRVVNDYKLYAFVCLLFPRSCATAERILCVFFLSITSRKPAMPKKKYVQSKCLSIIYDYILFQELLSGIVNVLQEGRKS